MRRNYRRYQTMNEGYDIDFLEQAATREIKRICKDIDECNREIKRGMPEGNAPAIALYSKQLEQDYDKLTVLYVITSFVLRDADEGTDLEREIVSKVKGFIKWVKVDDYKASVYLDYASNLDSWLL